MNVSAERTRSLWMQTEVLPEADALQADLKADVLIVGSGMAGLSAAYELAQTGRKVIVVDRGRICGGMTARTTAHLAICDDGISSLINLRGADTARLFHESQQAAIDRMEAIVKQHGIDCDFRRVEGILFPALDLSRDEAAKQLDKELEAAEKSGLVVARATGLRNPGSERVLVATGDSGQGITHGALAGMLLKDLVVAGSSPWQETYEPSRKPARAIVNYVRENVTALKNFAEYVLPGDIESIGQLQPGQGGVLNDGLRRLAVCRDVAGALHVHSAACTHLGCHVNWNATEQCWDCPCHGSQFAPDGAVLNGPALSPLAVADIPQVRRRA
jgi:Rieske Fe-S protein